MHCLYGGYNLHRFSDALGLVLSPLYLIQGVSNVETTFRISGTVNLLVVSDLTFDPCFKVNLSQLTQDSISVSFGKIVWNIWKENWKSLPLFGCEYFSGIRFNI